jgi:hypothetical protein
LILIKLLGRVDTGRLKSPVIGTNTPQPTAATGKNNYLGRRVVAQVHGERTEKLQFNFPPAEFAATAMKRFGEFTKAQTEQLSNLQETNRQWLERVQAEASLASELISKLTAARSIPDAMSAYQEWGSRRLAMMAEDTKHLMDNTQKFMQTSARLIANGWQ